MSAFFYCGDCTISSCYFQWRYIQFHATIRFRFKSKPSSTLKPKSFFCPRSINLKRPQTKIRFILVFLTIVATFYREKDVSCRIVFVQSTNCQNHTPHATYQTPDTQRTAATLTLTIPSMLHVTTQTTTSAQLVCRTPVTSSMFAAVH
jgi:hypothetical protein